MFISIGMAAWRILADVAKRQSRQTRTLGRVTPPHDAVDDAQAAARGGLDVDEPHAATAKGAHSGLERSGNGRGHASTS